MTSRITARPKFTVSQLQSDAWAAWNASYAAEVKDPFYEVGRDLYRQAVHERVADLFSRSDEQNALLDTFLAASAA